MFCYGEWCTPAVQSRESCARLSKGSRATASVYPPCAGSTSLKECDCVTQTLVPSELILTTSLGSLTTSFQIVEGALGPHSGVSSHGLSSVALGSGVASHGFSSVALAGGAAGANSLSLNPALRPSDKENETVVTDLLGGGFSTSVPVLPSPVLSTTKRLSGASGAAKTIFDKPADSMDQERGILSMYCSMLRALIPCERVAIWISKPEDGEDGELADGEVGADPRGDFSQILMAFGRSSGLFADPRGSELGQ